MYCSYQGYQPVGLTKSLVSWLVDVLIRKLTFFFVEEFELYFSHPFIKMYKKTKMNLPRWLPES